jgi:hypothetical protein
MATIKVPLRKLSDLDVRFVSLVDRGANRMPFRVVKRDHQENPEMSLDLSSLSRVFKSEPTAPAKPEIVAVVLAKNDPKLVEQAQVLLKAEGLDLQVVTSYEDGTVSIAKSEDFQEGSTLVQASPQMALVVKGFDPYGTKMDALSFGEAAQARGFYSGLNGAMDTLRDMVYAKLTKADSPNTAVSEVKQVMTEFVQYVEALTSALPVSVFKADHPVNVLVEGFVAEAPAEVKKNDPVEPTSEEPQKTTEPVGTSGTGITEDKVAELVQKSVNPLVEGLTGLKTLVETLTANVQKVADAQAATEQKVADAVKKSEDATRAVQGTVVSAAPSGDRQQVQTKVTKSEDDDPRTGQFDTAFIRRR